MLRYYPINNVSQRETLLGLTQTERIYFALGRCGAGGARTTTTPVGSAKWFIFNVLAYIVTTSAEGE
ncbi:MAG: hypothetical protein ACK5W8_15990, partial [Pseudanabaena sp.]